MLYALQLLQLSVLSIENYFQLVRKVYQWRQKLPKQTREMYLEFVQEEGFLLILG